VGSLLHGCHVLRRFVLSLFIVKWYDNTEVQ
jgi:hypothetical protein